ncbi:MAG: hypothetical protein HFJ34_06175 [Clostridia bacterium]|nr:hypothetical protein [Clostridia bacterium]
MTNLEETILTLVNLALDDLYKNDAYLLETDSSEESMVFHFGRYLINHLEKNTLFDKCNVDCEYNRNIFNEKMYKEIFYDNKNHRIFPDIILHERGSNHNNLLAMEFKKSSNRDTQGKRNDILKLKALTDSHLNYKYKMGLFVRFGKIRRTVNIELFMDGKLIKDR